MKIKIMNYFSNTPGFDLRLPDPDSDDMCDYDSTFSNYMCYCTVHISRLKTVLHTTLQLTYFRDDAPRYDDGLTGDSMSFR